MWAQPIHCGSCCTDDRTSYHVRDNNTHIDDYLKTLPTDIVYFTVVQLTSGLGPNVKGYPFNIPSDLRIIGFFSGGSSASNPGT